MRILKMKCGINEGNLSKSWIECTFFSSEKKGAHKSDRKYDFNAFYMKMHL